MRRERLVRRQAGLPQEQRRWMALGLLLTVGRLVRSAVVSHRSSAGPRCSPRRFSTCCCFRMVWLRTSVVSLRRCVNRLWWLGARGGGSVVSRGKEGVLQSKRRAHAGTKPCSHIRAILMSNLRARHFPTSPGTPHLLALELDDALLKSRIHRLRQATRLGGQLFAQPQ